MRYGKTWCRSEQFIFNKRLNGKGSLCWRTKNSIVRGLQMPKIFLMVDATEGKHSLLRNTQQGNIWKLTLVIDGDAQKMFKMETIVTCWNSRVY